MENEALKKALESLLFITDHPLSVEKLGKLVGVKDPPRIKALIEELKKELEDKGSAVQVLEVADGFQMATRPTFAPFVKKLYTERMTMRLSTAAHETLAIIAYKQPLTRAEIEQIRGVEVIAALETLLEKGLIKVVGRRETVGRPLMYGTTPDFLRHFGLRSVEDLPPLDQFTVESVPADSAVAPAIVAEESNNDTQAPDEILDQPPAAAVVEAAEDVVITPPQPLSEDVSPESKPRSIWGDEPAPEQ